MGTGECSQRETMAWEKAGPEANPQENPASTVQVEEKELAKEGEDQWLEGKEGNQKRVCSWEW